MATEYDFGDVSPALDKDGRPLGLWKVDPSRLGRRPPPKPQRFGDREGSAAFIVLCFLAAILACEIVLGAFGLVELFTGWRP